MKRFFISLFILLILINKNAHSQIDWQMQKAPDKLEFFKFLDCYEDEYNVVVTKAHQKAFQQKKYSVFVRTYGKDFQDFTETEMPDNAPSVMNLTSFSDYRVVYGNTNQVGNDYVGDNVIIILNSKGNTELTETWKHANKNRFASIPTIRVTSDSNYLIVVNNEIVGPPVPFKTNDNLFHVAVYDLSLKLLCKETFEMQQVFGGDGIDIKSLNFDYTPANGLIALVSRYNRKQKTEKMEIVISSVSDRGKIQEIGSVRLNADQIYFHYQRSKDNKTMYLMGSNADSKYFGNAKKALVYASIPLDSRGDAVTKVYNLDKTFYARFPEYAAIMKSEFCIPDIFILKDDGIYCFGEMVVVTTSKSSVTYTLRSITMMKYDYSGEIEWIKIHKKFAGAGDRPGFYYLNAFPVKDDIVMFYTDYPDHVLTPAKSKTVRLHGDGNFCLVMAIMNRDGDITSKEIIHQNKGNNVRASIPSIRQVNDNEFVIFGKMYNNNESFYLGKINIVK